MSTIFSKIINKQVPAKFVHEDELCVAFYDISPQAPLHILIVPREPIRSLADVKEEHKTVLGHLLWITHQLAVRFKVADKGFRTIINTNEWGGQTVYHLHVHLMGGKPQPDML